MVTPGTRRNSITNNRIPADPHPANSTIVVTLAGGASGIVDAVGNPFEGDPATPGVLQFQFQTVYEPPDPIVPPPVDVPRRDGAAYFATGSAVGAIAATSYETGRRNGVHDLTRWGDGNPVPNYGPALAGPAREPRLFETSGYVLRRHIETLGPRAAPLELRSRHH